MLYTNLARVALVWMDEWQEFYFKFNPGKCVGRDAAATAASAFFYGFRNGICCFLQKPRKSVTNNRFGPDWSSGTV